MKFLGLAVGALATTLLVGVNVGNAATIITHDFDDASNGQSSYTKDGYTYAPTNYNSSSSCYTAVVVGPGNGSCFLEVTNGTPTSLTRSSNAFDLLAFYFNFQGTAPNTLDLYGFTSGILNVPDTTTPNWSVTTTIALGSSYDGTGDFTIYEEDDFITAYTSDLKKGDGYFALFNSNFFDGVTQFVWEAAENKQIRVDCVSTSTDGANITASQLGGCTGATTAPVPLPAAGFLLIGALGGLGVAVRRRRNKHTS